jgi:hypothetical protein
LGITTVEGIGRAKKDAATEEWDDEEDVARVQCVYPYPVM